MAKSILFIEKPKTSALGRRSSEGKQDFALPWGEGGGEGFSGLQYAFLCPDSHQLNRVAFRAYLHMTKSPVIIFTLIIAGYRPHAWPVRRFSHSAEICQIPKCSECPVFLQGMLGFLLSFRM